MWIGEEIGQRKVRRIVCKMMLEVSYEMTAYRWLWRKDTCCADPALVVNGQENDDNDRKYS